MEHNKNVIYIVGLGPGDLSMLTGQAMEALDRSDLIIGYTVYADLIRDQFPGKEFLTTPMRKEIERCRLCYEKAKEGHVVSMICSGDAGVYGMAAPMYELLPEYPGCELCVVPGITAAISGAAVLGAPLAHDFCVISLSDLLTPWDVIEKRLISAVQGDFAIAIYNPSSRKRSDYLERACRIMMQAGADKDRVCGIVENIGREGTSCRVMTLEELEHTPVNMFTTVWIGSTNTFARDGRMITPRGYHI